MFEITACETIGKGKRKITLDNGFSFIVYRGEAYRLSLKEGSELSEEQYQYIQEILGKRAKKRALHLLEQMDRTEYQLREKLNKNDYPQQCIDEAIEYVKSYNYIDDYRYACNFVRFSQDKLSRLQIKQKLITKGVSRDDIEMAIEEEFKSDEIVQIEHLLDKRHFSGESTDQKEFQRTYQYILRRGFKSSDILKVMRQRETVFR